MKIKMVLNVVVSLALQKATASIERNIYQSQQRVKQQSTPDLV